MSRPPARKDRACLLDLDPDLAAVLGPEGTELVGRSPLLPVLGLPVGPWEPIRAPRLEPGTVAIGVLEGLLLRETSLPGGAALSGPGDLVEPWTERPELRWTACLPLRVAAIGRPLLSALQPWPQALARLLGRALHQESRQIASRTSAGRWHGDDERLLGQLGQLAARWGRRTAGGIVIELPLAGEVVGRLAGVPPDVVPGALHRLAERGAALQRSDGGWVLRGGDLRRPAAPAVLSRRERETTRDALIDSFARASEAHVDAVTATRELVGRLVVGRR